jgi:aminoglycoside phosphotransferase family enzyme
MNPTLGLCSARTDAVLDAVDHLLALWTSTIEARIAAGRIVDGHGDLRPGHICLVEPPVIYDCLEFDRSMRLLDPYDEVNFLGMECAMLGAGWVRPILLASLRETLGNPPDRRLLATFGAFRAVLRARLCLAHRLDADPREPERWVRRTRRYLGFAWRETVRASD